MSRVNEILEQIMLEDADAVLYSVMLSFLKRKAKEKELYIENLTLSIDEESKTIDVYSDINSRDEIGQYLIEEIKVN